MVEENSAEEVNLTDSEEDEATLESIIYLFPGLVNTYTDLTGLDLREESTLSELGIKDISVG